jgi:tetratricopeptide (TPR) repeat protein
MKYQGLVLVLILGSLLSCSDQKRIVKDTDYSGYLIEGILDKPVALAKEELFFWEQRLLSDSGSYVAMLELGAARQQLFKLTGDPQQLVLADSLFSRSSARLNDTDPDILYTRAQTAITRHQFAKASWLNESATQVDGDPFIHQLIGFDASMELGQYNDARIRLAAVQDPASFDYLIRKAKSEDQQGRLDKAIEYMEKALVLVKNKKKSLYCWTLSCLADMYGHDGRPEEAYKAYLTVLENDPADLYAIRGIAWIAFSHDRNTRTALELINYIQRQTSFPEGWLIKAEIMEWDNDLKRRDHCRQQFLKVINHPAYGDMYNKYLIMLYANDVACQDKAEVLAKREISNRTTPETFDWLAWAYFKKGEIRKALQISREKVYRQTSSPEAIYHTAMIFAAAGQKQEALYLFQECKASFFELGPLKEKSILEQISRLESM